MDRVLSDLDSGWFLLRIVLTALGSPSVQGAHKLGRSARYELGVLLYLGVPRADRLVAWPAISL